MTPRRLIFKSLCYYWKPYLAAVLGLAVSTAVVTGALIIADSVKSTIRQNALSRLGSIRLALSAPRLIPISRESNATPAILLNGSTMTDESVASVTDVTVVGIDSWFGKSFGSPMVLPGDGQCVLNQRLADELSVKEGQDILVSVPLQSQAPISSLFGRRGISEQRSLLRVSVAKILPDKGIGSFSLDPSSRPRRNVFLNLSWLNRQLGAPSTCNVFLVSDPDATRPISVKLRAEDCGLKASGDLLHFDLLVFQPDVLAAIVKDNPMADVGAVYLASRIEGSSRKSSSYSVVGSRSSFGLQKDEAVLTQWLAEDIGASAGSSIIIEWMESQPNGNYLTRSAKCKVKSVLPNTSIDDSWTPEFKGITNATTLDKWDPPFPFDSKRVTARDEGFWDRYKAAPKAWINQDLMDRMWGSPTVTTIAGASRLNIKQLAKASGLVYQPVRQKALDAAQGSTDFAGLFLGLGIFIIVSGLAFASGTLKLALAQRSKQFGLMSACGIPMDRIRRYVAAEGAVLGVKGAFIGVAGGAGYAWAVVKLLNSGWSDAVGSTAVDLHIGWQELAMGFGIGLFVSLLTVWLAARTLSRKPVLELLQSTQTVSAEPFNPKRLKGRYFLGVLFFAPLLLNAFLQESVGLAIASGLCWLIAGLLFLKLNLDMPVVKPYSLRKLAYKNLSARRGQAILVASLLACASFTLVAVAANARLMTPKDLEKRSSGSGGFSLILTTNTGLPYDLNSKEGRQKLGLPDDPALKSIKAVSFLMQMGDDASCLNMAKPQSPTVLGLLAPNELSGRFTIKGQSLSNLSGGSDQTDKTIQAAADSETAEWILHTGLGKDFKLEKPNRTVTIKSLINKSIFAREIIVGKEDFRRMFPGNDAPRFLLIETQNKEQVAKLLKESLADYGAKVERVDRLMADLMGVQNAYIKTFLALGGLGLALGMFGLVSALLRNIAERRKELALLSACGFSKAHIVKLLLMESAGVMVYGIGLGTLSALFAVIKIASQTITGAWLTLAIAIGATLLTGIATCVLATMLAVRKDLVRALRSE